MSPNQRPWAMLGIPIDCVGSKPGDAAHGTELSPDALRKAGIASVLKMDDYGDLTGVRIDRSSRDAVSGIIGYESVCAMTTTVRTQVAQYLQWGTRLFLVGGCCSFVPAAVAGACDFYKKRIGLAYFDGHIDLYTGQTSPTGEFADMPIAALLGHVPDRLLGNTAILLPEHVALLGFRDLEEAKSHGSLLPSDLSESIMACDVKNIREVGPEQTGQTAASIFAAWAGQFWVHFDVDVLDQSVFPATDYLMPGGLRWEEARQLLRPLIRNPALIGVSLGCYNPEKDPEANCAKDIVSNLAAIFAP